MVMPASLNPRKGPMTPEEKSARNTGYGRKYYERRVTEDRGPAAEALHRPEIEALLIQESATTARAVDMLPRVKEALGMAQKNPALTARMLSAKLEELRNKGRLKLYAGGGGTAGAFSADEIRNMRGKRTMMPPQDEGVRSP